MTVLHILPSLLPNSCSTYPCPWTPYSASSVSAQSCPAGKELPFTTPPLLGHCLQLPQTPSAPCLTSLKPPFIPASGGAKSHAVCAVPAVWGQFQSCHLLALYTNPDSLWVVFKIRLWSSSHYIIVMTPMVLEVVGELA